MKNRKLPDILTDEEVKALLNVFNRRYPTALRNRCMINLALNTGMRIGDLAALKWEDIELDTGRCHIKQGKNKKDRVIFIKAAILSDLVDLAAKMKRDRTGLVFTTLQGKPLYTQYLRRMIAEKAKKAGISKRVHFHLLRHTYLTRFYARTKDIRATQEVAGHADISTTQIYTHVSGEDIRAYMLEDDAPTTPAADQGAAIAGMIKAQKEMETETATVHIKDVFGRYKKRWKVGSRFPVYVNAGWTINSFGNSYTHMTEPPGVVGREPIAVEVTVPTASELEALVGFYDGSPDADKKQIGEIVVTYTPVKTGTHTRMTIISGKEDEEEVPFSYPASLNVDVIRNYEVVYKEKARTHSVRLWNFHHGYQEGKE